MSSLHSVICTSHILLMQFFCVQDFGVPPRLSNEIPTNASAPVPNDSSVELINSKQRASTTDGDFEFVRNSSRLFS